ncbi:MAG TPA: hypothetical protein VIU12_28280, partial [Chryseolinea sp.]
MLYERVHEPGQLRLIENAFEVDLHVPQGKRPGWFLNSSFGSTPGLRYQGQVHYFNAFKVSAHRAACRLPALGGAPKGQGRLNSILLLVLAVLYFPFRPTTQNCSWAGMGGSLNLLKDFVQLLIGKFALRECRQ